MRILTRYVLREFVVPLAYCLGGFISIYVLFELFGSFSRLMEAKLPFGITVEYFAGYIAPYFHYMATAAMMLATLYTMWMFCRHSEIVAMRASGISFTTIVKPLLAVSLLMAGFVVWVNEWYVPHKSQLAMGLKCEKFDLAEATRADNLVYRNSAARRTWTVDALGDTDATSLKNVKLAFDREGGVRERAVFAERAEYLDGEWWFFGTKVQHYDAGQAEIPSPTPELDALSTRTFPGLDETPEDFLMQNRDWRYNSVAGRLRYLRTHGELSPERRQDLTYDVWSQIMAPFACIIITLFSIPAGIASGRQSVFRGVLGAIGCFFAYYGTTILFMIVAKNGWMPAIPAAVLPGVVFLCLGIRSFWRQR